MTEIKSKSILQNIILNNCRVPSVVDAWRLALEFARSTTVKHIRRSAEINAFIKIRLVRLYAALAMKSLILTPGSKKLQISYGRNKSESSPIAPFETPYN